MIYNGVTEYLHQWCMAMEKKFYSENLAELERTGRSLLLVKRHFFDEMAYKLCSLVDREFGDFGAYTEAVRELVKLRKSYLLRNQRDPEAHELLAEAEGEFLDFADRVKETDTARADSYFRVILGEEREWLEYEILEKWGYCVDYWYPLRGTFDERKLFLNADYLESHWDRLETMLGLPGQRLYEYGESFFDDGQLVQVDGIYGYGGNECAYLPEDLSWIIYFSHENTVTFAGTILPMVKELLSPEREHWNKWD